MTRRALFSRPAAFGPYMIPLVSTEVSAGHELNQIFAKPKFDFSAKFAQICIRNTNVKAKNLPGHFILT